MKKIIVYGLGVIGREVVKELQTREKEFQIVACIDKKDLQSEVAFEVKKPEDLKELEYDYVLLTSEKWFAEISWELENKYGVRKSTIIHLKELIRDEEYECNLCKNNIPFMLDAGFDSPLFVKQKVIGGGKRKKCMCPLCGGNDRERWVQYVLEKELDIYNKPADVLHFAPEKQIEKCLRNDRELKYITADIEEGKADRVEDITHISFDDSTFDYIICNHILEHVSDEKRAFSELKRCLKRTGKIIFSVPICWEVDTIEDPAIVTKEGRLQVYGQEDHVRLYGKDIQKRLEDNGFCVKKYQPSSILTVEEIEKMRVISEDTVWVLMCSNV